MNEDKPKEEENVNIVINTWNYDQKTALKALQKHLKDRDLLFVGRRPDDLLTFGKDLEKVFKDFFANSGLRYWDESMKNTPQRVSKMYSQELFQGLSYDNFPAIQLQQTTDHDTFIIVKDLPVRSICEHHFLPVLGKCDISYSPLGGRLLGLSKFGRVVSFYSRKPSLQERLTNEIREALSFILDTSDICVKIEATHSCMTLRGVQVEDSKTTTISYRNCTNRFKNHLAL